MLEEHLGGHNGITHTDEGVLRWVISKLKINSMLDIGCGPGGMVEIANWYGLDAHGIDGDYTLERFDKEKFTIHDFTTGPAPINKQYDLGWSCEFVEHVYEEYIPNYAQAMQQCKYLIMTYSPVGHTGHHHVNCNTQEYWIEQLNKYGFVLDSTLTTEMRQASTMGKKRKHQFINQTGMLFRNEPK